MKKNELCGNNRERLFVQLVFGDDDDREERNCRGEIFSLISIHSKFKLFDFFSSFEKTTLQWYVRVSLSLVHIVNIQ